MNQDTRITESSDPLAAEPTACGYCCLCFGCRCPT